MRHQKEDPFLAHIRSGLGGNEADNTSEAEARPHNDKVSRETDTEADAESKVSDDVIREAEVTVWQNRKPRTLRMQR